MLAMQLGSDFIIPLKSWVEWCVVRPGFIDH